MAPVSRAVSRACARGELTRELDASRRHAQGWVLAGWSHDAVQTTRQQQQWNAIQCLPESAAGPAAAAPAWRLKAAASSCSKANGRQKCAEQQPTTNPNQANKQWGSRQPNHRNLPTHLALRCGCRGGRVCACGKSRDSSGGRSNLSGLPVSCLHHLLCRRVAHCSGCVGAGGCRLCRRQKGGQEWWWDRVRVNSGMESEGGLAGRGRREAQQVHWPASHNTTCTSRPRAPQ